MKPQFFQYDMMDGAVEAKGSDYYDSRSLLVKIMMAKYDISDHDLHNISIVKSKLRDLNIDELLK